jgi:hypothetical protein
MMPRARCERRTTLDDLFGPEPWEEPEIRAARQELTDRIDAEVEAIFRPVFVLVMEEIDRHRGSREPVQDVTRHRPWLSCPAAADILIRAFARSQDACRRIAHLKDRRRELCQGPFWKMSAIEDEGVDVAIRAGLLWEGKWSLKVELFPPLRRWLADVLYSLEDSIRWGEQAICRILDGLRRAIVHLARRVPTSIDRCLSAIDEALAALEYHAPIEARMSPPAAMLRRLLDVLLTPRVLAAGGDFELFVTRC